jgi:hypothetical protein
MQNMRKPIAELLYTTKSWNKRHHTAIVDKLNREDWSFTTYEHSVLLRYLHILFMFQQTREFLTNKVQADPTFFTSTFHGIQPNRRMRMSDVAKQAVKSIVSFINPIILDERLKAFFKGLRSGTK